MRTTTPAPPPPPPPFQGPVIGFPSVTTPPLPSHGTVFSSTAPVCLPPPASDGTPIHYLFLILCFSTSFPSNANWTRKVNEQLPGTYSIAGSQTEVISVLIGGPISQMRATEAQRGKWLSRPGSQSWDQTPGIFTPETTVFPTSWWCVCHASSLCSKEK